MSYDITIWCKKRPALPGALPERGLFAPDTEGGWVHETPEGRVSVGEPTPCEAEDAPDPIVRSLKTLLETRRIYPPVPVPSSGRKLQGI